MVLFEKKGTLKLIKNNIIR